jgi:hypothetical protein
MCFEVYDFHIIVGEQTTSRVSDDVASVVRKASVPMEVAPMRESMFVSHLASN